MTCTIAIILLISFPWHE